MFDNGASLSCSETRGMEALTPVMMVDMVNTVVMPGWHPGRDGPAVNPEGHPGQHDHQSRGEVGLQQEEEDVAPQALDLQRAGLSVQREAAEVHVAHGGDSDSAGKTDTKENKH
ncbi:hypothetical protein EYF80_034444 [Liparis tanakae]|uniref:Uncharacterized protein n=1 Tax=Liparis tanakae TaxID=230148 RepID=A0A4Z2GRH9_9TELE|nr:hypothetical protein EYF80_034444 [Liparis tanakae]